MDAVVFCGGCSAPLAFSWWNVPLSSCAVLELQWAPNNELQDGTLLELGRFREEPWLIHFFSHSVTPLETCTLG